MTRYTTRKEAQDALRRILKRDAAAPVCVIPAHDGRGWVLVTIPTE